MRSSHPVRRSNADRIDCPVDNSKEKDSTMRKIIALTAVSRPDVRLVRQRHAPRTAGSAADDLPVNPLECPG